MGDFRSDMLEKTKGLLKRPRIDALLRDGLKLPLVTVLAGPGYGKSIAVAAYVKSSAARQAWLRLTRLDNVPMRFWHTLVYALEGVLTKTVIEQLNELGFPDTLGKLDAFVRIVAQEIYSGDMILIVVDDYDNIQDQDIRNFFKYLIEAQIENCCMIILSATYTDIGDVGKSCGGVFEITAEDLRFTPEETRELLLLNGITLPSEAIQKIDLDIEGWPLALFMLIMQIKAGSINYGASLDMVDRVFEREFFSKYSEEIQHLLIQLSLLHGFTYDIVRGVVQRNVPQAMDIIKENMFILYDEHSQLYVFQNMYRTFLNERRYMLSKEDIERGYAVAGDSFSKHRFILEAIDCYAKCQRYEQMLLEICAFANTRRIGFSRGQAAYFMEHLNSFPQEFLDSHPMADYLKASVYLNNLETDRAYELLEVLEARLLREYDDKEKRPLLGEIYSLMGAIQMMRNRENFGEYYEKACRCLPQGDTIRPKGMMRVENHFVFSMQDYTPGALERMEKAAHRGVPYMARFHNGGANGLAHVFSCEAAYNTYRLDDAEMFAHQAIDIAQEDQQHDMVCNAYAMLAHIALMHGEYESIWYHVNFIRNYINDHNIVVLHELRDTMTSWFYLMMEDPDKIVPWILDISNNDHDQSPIAIGRERMVYAKYLLYKRSYTELLALLERLDRHYQSRGSWTERLMGHIIRALAYLRMGNETEAIEAFRYAYEMSVYNNIVTPFIEMGSGMRTLIDTVRRVQEDDFDKAWMDSIYQKSSTFAKKLSAVVGEYRARNKLQLPSGIKLTRRETEVLHNMSQGLTREEIAGMQNVSINTVKSNISNIYNKLGAVNRADAVRIATTLGIVS